MKKIMYIIDKIFIICYNLYNEFLINFELIKHKYYVMKNIMYIRILFCNKEKRFKVFFLYHKNLNLFDLFLCFYMTIIFFIKRFFIRLNLRLLFLNLILKLIDKLLLINSSLNKLLLRAKFPPIFPDLKLEEFRGAIEKRINNYKGNNPNDFYADPFYFDEHVLNITKTLDVINSNIDLYINVTNGYYPFYDYLNYKVHIHVVTSKKFSKLDAFFSKFDYILYSRNKLCILNNRGYTFRYKQRKIPGFFDRAVEIHKIDFVESLNTFVPSNSISQLAMYLGTFFIIAICVSFLKRLYNYYIKWKEEKKKNK